MANMAKHIALVGKGGVYTELYNTQFRPDAEANAAEDKDGESTGSGEN